MVKSLLFVAYLWSTAWCFVDFSVQIDCVDALQIDCTRVELETVGVSCQFVINIKIVHAIAKTT